MTSLTRPNNGIRNTTSLPGTHTTGLPGWSRFDDIFGDIFPETPKDGSRIQNLDENLEWSIDMPGVGEENIEIILENGNKLIVQTSYDDSNERRHYKKTLRLGDSIDTDGIEASDEDGVLTITLPKAKQTQDTRQIELD